MTKKIMHVADPGPDYWAWRCMRCSEPVEHHAGFWRVVWVWLTGER